MSACSVRVLGSRVQAGSFVHVSDGIPPPRTMVLRGVLGCPFLGGGVLRTPLRVLSTTFFLSTPLRTPPKLSVYTYPIGTAFSGPYRGTAPVAPARRSKARRGGVWVFPRGPQASPGQFSTIRARAGRCREGGLSSTDERVRGHVTEVTEALRKSSKWSPRVIHTYNRDDLNAN